MAIKSGNRGGSSFAELHFRVSENVVAKVEQGVERILTGFVSVKVNSHHCHFELVFQLKPATAPVGAESAWINGKFDLIAGIGHPADGLNIRLKMKVYGRPPTVVVHYMVEAPRFFAGAKNELRIIAAVRFRPDENFKAVPLVNAFDRTRLTGSPVKKDRRTVGEKYRTVYFAPMPAQLPDRTVILVCLA